MPYVNHRWLGGLLTNWRTMSDRIDRLHEMRRLRDEGQMDLLPAKERISMAGELEKLEANLGGVADMRRQPDAVVHHRPEEGALAVREARRLGLPVVALVDTNCDPDEADYVIPGNDDAIRSCDLIARVIADGDRRRASRRSRRRRSQQQAGRGAAPAAAAERRREDDVERVAAGEADRAGDRGRERARRRPEADPAKEAPRRRSAPRPRSETRRAAEEEAR